MKRKNLILMLAVIFLIVALSYLLFNNNGISQIQEISTIKGEDESRGELMVVPEVPLGILGSISALAISLGIFTLRKKKN